MALLPEIVEEGEDDLPDVYSHDPSSYIEKEKV